MKKYLLCFLILITLLTMPLIVTASNISLANYEATVTVSNNSTATTNVCVPFTLSVPNMVAAGYIDTSCTRVAMTNTGDLPFMPGYGANPWIVFVPSIGADATVRDSLYTSNTSLSSQKYYFPGSTGMAVLDNNINLEPSANFSISMTAYFNTTTNSSILSKLNTLYIYTASPGVIYANIGGRAIGSYFASSVSLSDPSSGWSSDANAIDSAVSTYATSNSTATASWTSYLVYSHAAIQLSNINFYINCGTPTGQLVDLDAYYGAAWHDVYQGTFVVNGFINAALTSPQTATDIRIRIYNAPGANWLGYVSDVWWVTSTVSSGEHNVNVYADSTNFKMDIDGVNVGSVALTGASVLPNVNNWAIGDDDATPYITSCNITIGGNLRGSWAWEYGDTFTDLSSSGNDATPSFRTTSSDADVSATISSFVALHTATAPVYTVTDTGTLFYSGNITVSGNFTSGNTSSGGPAVLDIVDDTSDAGGIPRAFIWGILGCVTFSAMGLGLSYARKKFAIGGGYVLILLIIGILIIGLLVAFGKFDWWMIWFYIIIAGGIAMASRHLDWGGATSQHSLIGFLAMSWVGLTLINRILEGAFITTAETAYLNTITFTKAFSLLNLFTIPIMNWGFFTKGIPTLLKWDYSFFGGQAQIIQYLLYSVTAVVSFIIFTIILGLVYSAITRST